MKKNNIMPIIVLSAICLVVAFVLSLINSVTGPIIAEAQNQAANSALLEVLPEGQNFEELTLDENYPAVITKGYKADSGFVFQATVAGKSAGLIIMIGIDTEGKIVGTQVVADQETDSYDVNVFPLVSGTEGAYKGMALDSFEPFLVSGATLTSKAYGEAVKAALQAFAIANGGEIDLRDPAQILQDNCNAALGTEGKTFEKWFATEEIGVDALYITDGGAVAFIYGCYIGIDADGNVSTEGVNAETGEKETIGDGHYAAANSAFIIYSESTLTELASLPEGVKTKIVKKAYVTSSGNYVFELEAQGYDILMGYGTNVPIKIKLSISADGKIIDCLTVSHNESKGYGEACATEEYYDQYRGASSSDVNVAVSSPDLHLDQIPADNTDVGVIASSTFTTYGYQKAVKAAFEAFELIIGEGGN